MKNKKMLYILVPAVIFIWGAVAYSIFSHRHGSDSNFDRLYAPVPIKALDIDSNKYQLLANYRDPFGTGTRIARTEDIDRSRLLQNQSNDQQVYWPQVQYQGMIINNKKWVALVKVDNSNLLFQEGEEKMNIKLLKMFADSVLLEYQNSIKTFGKVHNR